MSIGTLGMDTALLSSVVVTKLSSVLNQSVELDGVESREP